MSGASSSAAAWSALLEPTAPPTDLPRRPDDPRLGAVTECWNGALAALRPGRAVLVGFPQDEGVRRNQGRPGAAAAPRAIRRWLGRLTPSDACANLDLRADPPLDLGDVRVTADLEASQAALGVVLGELLRRQTVPIVLGGGHETAYGHYLGYVAAGLPVAVVNVDAHLDVRPLIAGQGHSGSPFRQMLEHPTQPLPGRHYACVGAQPQAVSHDHFQYVQQGGGQVVWKVRESISPPLASCIRGIVDAWARTGLATMLTVDADAFSVRDVPGVSAPNSAGLPGDVGLKLARAAGRWGLVRSMDLVEISPPLDRDDQSARWGALFVWHFLMGLRMHQQAGERL